MESNKIDFLTTCILLIVSLIDSKTTDFLNDFYSIRI